MAENRQNQTAAALAQARASMYRFLGGLYIMEVDKEQLEALKAMTFPEVEGKSDADQDLRDGYSLIKDYVSKITEEDLDDLAADYAKVFLAAGDATGKAAFPYESVYVDKRHRVGGSTEMQMHSLYLKRGLMADPDVYRTMDDNIGLMLEYQANICEEQAAAFQNEDTKKAEELLTEQARFLKKHLTNWVFSFTSDIIRYSERDFYKGVARLTNGFIRKESELLKEGISAWEIN